MAKVNIDKSQPIGNRIALAMQRAHELQALLQECDDASAIAQASPQVSPLGSAALEGATYGFGFGTGQGPDGASALTGFRQAYDTFMAAQSGKVATLYSGIVE